MAKLSLLDEEIQVRDERIRELEASLAAAQHALKTMAQEKGHRALDPRNLALVDVNQQQQALLRAHDELEKRLAERTEAVEQANDALKKELDERRRAEEARLESEQRFRIVFEKAETGIAVGDLEGHVIDCNPAFGKMLGYSQDEIRHMHYSVFTHPGDMDAEAALVAKVLAGENDHYEIEKRYIRKDGQVIDVRLVANLVLGDSGEPVMAITMAEDITERKRAEEALVKAHADLENEHNRLLAVVDALPVGVAIMDEMGGVTLANPEYEAVWGSPRPPADSIDDYDLYQAWWVDTGERVQAEEWASARAVQHGETVTGQYIRIRKFDSSDGYIINSGAPVRDQQGNIIGATVAIQDVTDRVQVEEALRLSEDRLRMALSSLPLSVYTMDRERRYTWVHNPQHVFKGENVLGRRDEDLYSPNAAAQAIALKQMVIDTGQSIQKEVEVQIDGSPRQFLLTLEPRRDASGGVIGLIGASLDITERKRVMAERANALSQAAVRRQLLENREQERLELARELHDGPIQQLAGASFHVQAALEAAYNPEVIEGLEKAALIVKEVIIELRDTMNDLRPPGVIRFGFAASTKVYAEEFRARHPSARVDLHLAEDAGRLDESVTLVLYRILQEGLHNAVRHGQATHIWVSSSIKGGALHLKIRDNGLGFETPTDLVQHTQNRRYGLAGMKERAEAAGGEWAVTSAPGKGATIEVTVPLAGPGRSRR